MTLLLVGVGAFWTRLSCDCAELYCVRCVVQRFARKSACGRSTTSTWTGSSSCRSSPASSPSIADKSVACLCARTLLIAASFGCWQYLFIAIQPAAQEFISFLILFCGRMWLLQLPLMRAVRFVQSTRRSCSLARSCSPSSRTTKSRTSSMSVLRCFAACHWLLTFACCPLCRKCDRSRRRKTRPCRISTL